MTEAEIAAKLTPGQVRTLLFVARLGGPWAKAQTPGQSIAGYSLAEKRLVHRDKQGVGTWLMLTDLGRRVADLLREREAPKR